MANHARPPRQIVIVAALAKENRCIGRDMEVPWHIPEDLRHFKKLTVGGSVIMGRRTFYSVINQLGKPLPARRSLVLTRQGPLADYPQVETFASLPAALDAVRTDHTAYVIGGGQVYAEALPLATRLELTIVDGREEGDTFFPEYAHLLDTEFIQSKSIPKEGFCFETWDRVATNSLARQDVAV